MQSGSTRKLLSLAKNNVDRRWLRYMGSVFGGSHFSEGRERQGEHKEEEVQLQLEQKKGRED